MDSPLTRALAHIDADPLRRAAYELGCERGFTDGYAQGWQDSPESDGEAYDDTDSKAAAYLLLAEAPPEPPRVWTVDEAARLRREGEHRRRELFRLDDQIAACELRLSFADIDPTDRAATEGALNVACERLAALLPEVNRG